MPAFLPADSSGSSAPRLRFSLPARQAFTWRGYAELSHHPSCFGARGSTTSCFRLPALQTTFPLKGKIPISNIHQLFCLFLQKARTVRNTKRHPDFIGKTFALRVRVALMNIWIVIKKQMLYNVGKCRIV